MIEADGAKHLPCKAPAEHEPALLSCSDIVVGVTGLSALGQSLQKGCFRAALASELLGCSMDHRISAADLAQLIAAKTGQQKNLEGRSFYAVLHQYEEKEHREAALEIAERLQEQGIGHVLFTCAGESRSNENGTEYPWHGRAEIPMR